MLALIKTLNKDVSSMSTTNTRQLSLYRIDPLKLPSTKKYAGKDYKKLTKCISCDENVIRIYVSKFA